MTKNSAWPKMVLVVVGWFFLLWVMLITQAKVIFQEAHTEFQQQAVLCNCYVTCHKMSFSLTFFIWEVGKLAQLSHDLQPCVCSCVPFAVYTRARDSLVLFLWMFVSHIESLFRTSRPSVITEWNCTQLFRMMALLNCVTPMLSALSKKVAWWFTWGRQKQSVLFMFTDIFFLPQVNI